MRVHRSGQERNPAIELHPLRFPNGRTQACTGLKIGQVQKDRASLNERTPVLKQSRHNA